MCFHVYCSKYLRLLNQGCTKYTLDKDKSFVPRTVTLIWNSCSRLCISLEEKWVPLNGNVACGRFWCPYRRLRQEEPRLRDYFPAVKCLLIASPKVTWDPFLLIGLGQFVYLLFIFYPVSVFLFLSLGFNERYCHSHTSRRGEKSGQKMSWESCLDQLHKTHRIRQNRRSVQWAIAEVAVRANNAY